MDGQGAEARERDILYSTEKCGQAIVRSICDAVDLIQMLMISAVLTLRRDRKQARRCFNFEAGMNARVHSNMGHVATARSSFSSFLFSRRIAAKRRRKQSCLACFWTSHSTTPQVPVNQVLEVRIFDNHVTLGWHSISDTALYPVSNLTDTDDHVHST
jgi:hypothetical protein